MKKLTKVYVVAEFHSITDDPYIHGIFTTFEHAKALADYLENHKVDDDDSYVVREHVLETEMRSYLKLLKEDKNEETN